jgi:nucleoside-diphosphate-sugar epimerase
MSMATYARKGTYAHGSCITGRILSVLCLVLSALVLTLLHTEYGHSRSLYFSPPCISPSFTEVARSTQPKVAIIGAAGYVGARLHEYMNRTTHASIYGYDRDPRGLAQRVLHKSALEIDDDTLAGLTAVVYLGGYTGRVMCDASPSQCLKENVDETVAFARRLSRHQLLVFASTSAITEGSGGTPWSEDGSVRTDLLDSYSSSMRAREQALGKFATEPGAPQMIGVR